MLRLGVLGFGLLWVAFPANAKVFHSRETALKAAFPAADQISAQDLFLSETDLAKLQNSSGERLRSRLIRVYVGKRGDKTIGYALIDTVVVRTLPATLLIALSPSGALDAVHVLAFHEPPEYMPSAQWLARLRGTRSSTAGAVSGIAGATLTANAIRQRVRAALALYDLFLRTPKQVAPPPSR